MPKYLFTNDQRISVLADRIKWVADFIQKGHELTEIKNKSDNNNATTLAFYYNLYPGTETCLKAAADPSYAIRNFVLKFQFPNVRTPESFADSLAERAFFAPLRSVVKMLYLMAVESDSGESWLSLDEVLYYLFCNPIVYKNPWFDCGLVKKDIENGRSEFFDMKERITAKLEWKQGDRQIRELLTVLNIACPCFVISKNKITLNINSEEYEVNKEYILQLLNYSKFWYPTNPSDINLSTLEYISYMDTQNTPYSVIEYKPEFDSKENRLDEQSLQQIFYGAPGTGKSHIVKELTKGESVIRTTFHPDSDYSTFVGAYKPTMGQLQIFDEAGQPFTVGGKTLYKEQIKYEFVEQAFMQAYIKAWEYYKDAGLGDKPKKQFLIIEEINRGNCAQIFGDLFQLLDRKASGFSDYPIHADNDLKKQLAKSFEGWSIPQTNEINACYEGQDIVSQVLSGDILLLPNNLFIWATMNTSDQSLFPIDSAFKRRWDWQYMPICKGRNENGNELNWKISADTKEYDWWSFINEINKRIDSIWHSEDKKLGFFFCKAEDGVISSELFVGKVIFYLWNDVFKDYGFEGEVFKDSDGEKLAFTKFFDTDNRGRTVVRKEKVELFLNNLGITVVDEVKEEDDDGNSDTSTNRDYTKFSVNDSGRYGKNKLAVACVKEYIELNPSMSAEDVVKNWKSLGNFVPHFIESKEEFEGRKDSGKRSDAIKCGDTYVYVSRNGYSGIEKVMELVDAIHGKEWNITIRRL